MPFIIPRIEVSLYPRDGGGQGLFTKLDFELRTVVRGDCPIVPASACISSARVRADCPHRRRQPLGIQIDFVCKAVRQLDIKAQDGVFVFRVVLGDALTLAGLGVHHENHKRHN